MLVQKYLNALHRRTMPVTVVTSSWHTICRLLHTQRCQDEHNTRNWTFTTAVCGTVYLSWRVTSHSRHSRHVFFSNYWRLLWHAATSVIWNRCLFNRIIIITSKSWCRKQQWVILCDVPGVHALVLTAVSGSATVPLAFSIFSTSSNEGIAASASTQP